MKVKKPQSKFVLCVRSEGLDDLEPRKVYQVLPHRAPMRDGYMRVIDESGEDYLYPAEYFVPVKFPVAIARESLVPFDKASHPQAQRARRG